MVLAVLLSLLLIRGLDWVQVLRHVRYFPLDTFFWALAAFVAATSLRAWRWYVLIARERINFLRLYLIQNAGLGLNNLSPIRVVSEPLQLALVTRRGRVSAPVAVATLAAEHAIDILVTAAFLALGFIILPALQRFGIQIIGAVVLSVASLIMFMVIVKGMDFIPAMQRFRFAAAAIGAIKNLRHSPFRLVFSIAAGTGYWMLVGLSGWLAANALDINIGAIELLMLLIGSLVVVSVVPSLPGGAVTFEAAMVYIMKPFGVPTEPALAFAVIMHIIMFAPSTLIAFLVLPREGIKMFGRKDPTVIEERVKKEVV
ncbi:MAG: flippase-like domain-containing protein [Chloroflexi bacterium]|nr:flippase-like domain-containing protein [Chloroflexota bacterium]